MHGKEGCGLLERLLRGLVGAFLGAVIALGAGCWWDEANWPVVAGAAAVGGVLAAVGGETVLELLKEIWWWS
jgi:hypothetical protein